MDCGGPYKVLKYIFGIHVSLIMAPVRHQICVIGKWKNPLNVWNAPVILENKISSSLTIVGVSSFRPSQDIYCCKTIKMMTHSRKCSQIMNLNGILIVALADTCEYPTSTKLPANTNYNKYNHITTYVFINIILYRCFL